MAYHNPQVLTSTVLLDTARSQEWSRPCTTGDPHVSCHAI